MKGSQNSSDQQGTVQEADVCITGPAASLEEPDSPYNDSELSDDYTGSFLSAPPLKSEY